MATPEPPDLTVDLERTAEKWYAGAIKHGGLEAALHAILKPVIGLVAGIVGFLFSILDPIALAIGKAIIEGFNTAAGGPLGTLLELAATEFREAIGGGGGKFGGTAEAGREIAAAFIDRIIRDTPSNDEWGITPSLDPAKSFLGMMTEVGLRGWAMDLLAELETVGLIHAFEDLIGIISRTMGFGRLARVALKPIIDATIGASVLNYVNLAYRPHLLGEGLAVREVIRGVKDGAWLDEELGRQGYSGDRIAAIVEANRVRIPLADLDRLVRAGIQSPQAFIDDAAGAGYTPEDGSLIRQAMDLTRRDALNQKTLDVGLQLLHDGVYTEGQFQQLLTTLQIPVDEQAQWSIIATLRLLFPRKVLSVAELNELLARNLISTGEYRDQLDRHGYSPADAVLLELLQQAITHDKQSAAAAREQIRQEKATAAAQKKAQEAVAAAARKQELAAKRKDQQDFIQAKAAAASQAAIDRITQTAHALTERHALIDQAEKDKLLTATEAEQQRAQLATLTAQHTAQTAAHQQQMTAIDEEAKAVDASHVAETTTAAKVAETTAAAQQRAAVDQQILDARRADRQAGYALARVSAQASFDAGEITAGALAKKLRAIDLQEQKDITSEDLTELQIEKATQAAETAAAKGQIDITALQEKATIAPAASRRRQDAIAAGLADHLSTAADVGTRRVAQLSELANKRIAAADAAATRRGALDQELAQQRIALEELIQSRKPKPPG